MSKRRLMPSAADSLHGWALTQGFKDIPIPEAAQYERHRIATDEMAMQGQLIIFYNSRNNVTLSGHGADELFNEYLEVLRNG